jgi:acyl carrier protein
MDVMESLTRVFREVFDDDDITLTRETTANDVDGWDSLTHVNLILSVESRFGIRFSQAELLTFRNVGDLADSIRKRLPA